MKPLKDMNDLYQRDPERFDSNVLSLIEQAVPASEFVRRHPMKGSGASNVQSDDVPDARASAFDMTRDRVSLDELVTPPEPRAFVVAGMLPQDAGTLTGPGGGNKTTVTQWEGVHIMLGKPLYGRDILKPGGVILLSQEDERAKLLWRMSQIAQAMELTPGELKHVAESLYIPDLLGARVRLVHADSGGNLGCAAAVDDLIDCYSGTAISLVVFDPLVYFGPGERWANDGGAELLSAGRRIAHALGCCVEFIAHTSMATARSKQDDQYSARSAAAISDNGRFGRNLWTFADADRERFGSPPSGASSDDVANKRVLVLTQPKLSDGPPITEPTWLVRRGWCFEHLENEYRNPEQIELGDVQRLHAFLTNEEAQGKWHTAKTIEESHRTVGIPRNRLRAVVANAEGRGWVSQVEIPKGHAFRQGSRTHRLVPGVVP